MIVITTEKKSDLFDFVARNIRDKMQITNLERSDREKLTQWILENDADLNLSSRE